MFALAPGYKHPFSNLIRLHLIVSILERGENGCCGADIHQLLADESFLAVYPLHNKEMKDMLIRNWMPLHIPPWHQPTDLAKEYFGEKVALYFEFLGHYLTWLLPLAAAGLIVALDVLIEYGMFKDFTEALIRGYLIPFYSIFVAFWSTLMLEYWKRKESAKAMVRCVRSSCCSGAVAQYDANIFTTYIHTCPSVVKHTHHVYYIAMGYGRLRGERNRSQRIQGR
jgi:Calcium-activated chloride channel